MFWLPHGMGGWFLLEYRLTLQALHKDLMRRELKQLQVQYEQLTEEHQVVLEKLHKYEQPSEDSGPVENTSTCIRLELLFCGIGASLPLYFLPPSNLPSSLPTPLSLPLPSLYLNLPLVLPCLPTFSLPSLSCYPM